MTRFDGGGRVTINEPGVKPKPNRKGSGPKRGQNSGEAQKARREKAAETGLPDMQRALRTEPIKTWADVEDDVVWVGDIVAAIGDVRYMANGGVNVSMYTGSAYAHAALEAAMCSSRQFVMVRVYTVPRDVMIADEGDEEAVGS